MLLPEEYPEYSASGSSSLAAAPELSMSEEAPPCCRRRLHPAPRCYPEEYPATIHEESYPAADIYP